MAYKVTTTTVLGRAVENGRDNRDLSRERTLQGYGHGAFNEHVEFYGQVEVVELTTVKYFRSDGTAHPNKDDERTERVLVTLDATQASRLIQSLSKAVVKALDSRYSEAPDSVRVREEI